MIRQPQRKRGTALRTLSAVGVVLPIVLAVVLLIYCLHVFLIIFAGILLAVMLSGLADWLSGRTGMKRGAALAVVLLTLAVLLVGSGVLFAGQIAVQIDELAGTVTQSAQQIYEQLQRYRWAQGLLDGNNWRQMLGGVAGVFSLGLGALAHVVVVLFVGIYGATNPGLYRDGLLRLVAPHRRQRVAETLDAVAAILRGWLLGKALAMLVVGVLTTVGLMLLGIPMALTLGLIAFLLDFIPNFGPLLAAVPALLLALTLGPAQVAYVAALFVGVQIIEGYVLTPLVQQKTADLPPALTISAQVVLSVLAGGVGLALAAPLAAAVMVAVRMLYVEDVLGDNVGASPAESA
jgi:predicted PurR-regulated permease PerM